MAVASVLVLGAIGVRSLVGINVDVEDESASAMVATTIASSVPTATITVSPASPSDRATARDLRAKMQRDLETGKFPAFITGVEELLRLDPEAAADRKLRSSIIDVLMVITAGRGEHADKLFDLIENRMGTHGIDLLYQLVIAHGGSRASARASALLVDPAVRARGTPALRVAYELRMAPCVHKNQLFKRAAEEGDTRSLQQLELLKNPCSRRNNCCPHAKDPELSQAIEAIRARSQG
ncbi:serine/threonine protein kinase [Chondromyces apiculatus DSM 436]|uniref:Serine/threonine protein kinase n=1 Tax=Chondromyces apiculatus DSM 436 TaxID=1192034 RepID=A0A017TCQ0_9BACT|nr:serine/threonine protein kinase [Chondromyces apiculatus DSM 436]